MGLRSHSDCCSVLIPSKGVALDALKLSRIPGGFICQVMKSTRRDERDVWRQFGNFDLRLSCADSHGYGGLLRS